jgi:negative regulator of replication initiation
MPRPKGTKPVIIDDRPFWETTDGNTARLYLGHVIDQLRRLPSRVVQVVVTSPPYW